MSEIKTVTATNSELEGELEDDLEAEAIPEPTTPTKTDIPEEGNTTTEGVNESGKTDTEKDATAAESNPAATPLDDENATKKRSRFLVGDKKKSALFGADIGKNESIETLSGSSRRKSRVGRRLKSTLESCRLLRQNASQIDDLDPPIDRPRVPTKYLPPFRRNFRYFGYPENLNLDLDTPPRVRSWGPIEEEAPPISLKRRPVDSTPDLTADHLWMGRLLRSCTILENPALLPILQKQRGFQKLGGKPIRLVEPDLEITNCPSHVYFPLAEKSRRAFCRINKIAQDSLKKKLHDFTIQHEHEYHETVNMKKLDEEVDREVLHKVRRTTRFSLADFQHKTADFLYYTQNDITPMMKSICLPDLYPGVNTHLYGRPLVTDDHEEENELVDDKPITGVIRLPDYQSSISTDVWEQLAKVRIRKAATHKHFDLAEKPDKFKVFNQLELRNQVLKATKHKFLQDLKQDMKAPLPEELFGDNRDQPEPEHDYENKGEFPPQGPFWWKTEREPPATEDEQLIIDAFVAELKEQKITHHLPGITHVPRHPYQPFELDWIEQGSETSEFHLGRKTPIDNLKLPEFVMTLDPKRFDEKVEKMVQQRPKDLVGPKIYSLYKLNRKGKPSPKPSIRELPVPVQSEKVHRRRKKKKKPKKSVEQEQDGEEEGEDEEEEGDEEEEEEEEEMEEEEEEEKEQEIKEYRLDADLEETLPLPDVRFSEVEFPDNEIPADAKKAVQRFRDLTERFMNLREEDDEEMADKVDELSVESVWDDDKTEEKELTLEEEMQLLLQQDQPQQPQHQVMLADELKAKFAASKAKQEGEDVQVLYSRNPDEKEPGIEERGLKDVFDKDGDIQDIALMWKQFNEQKEFVKFVEG